MSKFKIITYPNKILTSKARKVKDPLDPEIQKIIAEMINVMRKSDGMGLAANQVGIPLRICVIEEKMEKKVYILINPTITFFSREKIIIEEGCLSFPKKFIPIRRPEKIKLRALNEMGKNVKIKADGLLARVIQHEVDHLNGIVFTKYLKKSVEKKLL